MVGIRDNDEKEKMKRKKKKKKKEIEWPSEVGLMSPKDCRPPAFNVVMDSRRVVDGTAGSSDQVGEAPKELSMFAGSVVYD